MHVINIPKSVSRKEFQAAISQYQPNARVQLYVKNNESLGAGEVTFKLQSECDAFLRQIDVKPLRIGDRNIVFR